MRVIFMNKEGIPSEAILANPQMHLEQPNSSTKSFQNSILVVLTLYILVCQTIRRLGMFPDIHKGAELAFKVIKEREDQTLNEMAALRAEIKTRSGRR